MPLDDEAQTRRIFMRKNRLAVAILLVMTMLLGIMTTAFAADYTPVDPDDQGKTGIVGGDTLTFTEDTVWANLTARWGVRVIFQDGDEWNNAELKSELIPVTDSAAGSTTAPNDPSHDGWTFTGWERVDTNNGSSTLNDDGTVTDINGPGPIIYQAVYEPVSPKTGGLTVSKTISGDAADAAQAFTFTVTLSDTTVSGEFGDMAFKEGIATFTLKGGESVTAEGLPAGASYIVTESDNDGYEVTKTGDTGEIADGETAAAAFTNTKNSTPPEDPDDPPAEPKTGSLTISKTVTGTAGEKDKLFTFTVTIGASGSYSYTGSKSGTITSGGTVQLKHGESITISGIPADTSYMVAESDNEGYEVTKTGDTGTIAADAAATASFTNKKDAAPVTPPDKPGDPGTPKTGDNNNIALWISLLLTSFIGMMACIVLFRKKRAGKHMRIFMMLLLVGVMAFSCFGVTSAFAAEDGTTDYTYGQYNMTYLPGTTDTVTNMPANETGLTPGADNPYTVSSTVPVREGFEFIDWTLTWGTMEKPITLTGYVVKYLEVGTNIVLAPEKHVTEQEVGATVRESAVDIEGYIALAPTEAELVLAEDGNEIIFYYKRHVLTDYVVKYLDKDTNEPVAADKVQTGLEVGTSVTETAIPVDGYTAVDPTEATLILAETGNEIIFYYERQPVLTDYVVKYLDKDTNEPVADEKTESGLEVGTSVTETAIPVGGYAALDPTETTLVLAETGNEIIFYYQKLTTYTIHYCDALSGEEIEDPKTVTDVPVGETYTEYAIYIPRYTALDNEITFTLMESGNDYYLYYVKSDAD